jgi:hypothetical protein
MSKYSESITPKSNSFYGKCLITMLHSHLDREGCYGFPASTWSNVQIKWVKRPYFTYLRYTVCRSQHHPRRARPAHPTKLHLLIFRRLAENLHRPIIVDNGDIHLLLGGLYAGKDKIKTEVRKCGGVWSGDEVFVRLGDGAHWSSRTSFNERHILSRTGCCFSG